MMMRNPSTHPAIQACHRTALRGRQQRPKQHGSMVALRRFRPWETTSPTSTFFKLQPNPRSFSSITTTTHNSSTNTTTTTTTTTTATAQTRVEPLAMAQLKAKLGPLVTIASPWDSSTTTTTTPKEESSWGNLDFFPPLDNASRHVIQLLQQQSLQSPTKKDILTLDRCKHVLKGLWHHHRKVNATTGMDTMEQCAVRAHVLWKNLIIHHHHIHSSPDLVIKPDRHVCNLLLQLFSSTQHSADLEFPRRAQSIVHDMMKQQSEQPETGLAPHARHWNAVLMCWSNCTHPQRSIHAATETLAPMLQLDNNHNTASAAVVDASSWVHIMTACTTRGIAKSHHATASSLGAQVAARLWQRHFSPELVALENHGSLSNDDNDKDKNKSEKNDPTIPSSVSLSQKEEDRGEPTTRMEPTEPDSWNPPPQETENSPGTTTSEQPRTHHHDPWMGRLPPRFYSAFLQAIRGLPVQDNHNNHNNDDNNNTSLSSLRASLFDECLDHARHSGQVNRVVLNEFLVHVQSPAMTHKHLGPYLPALVGKSPAQAAALLEHELLPLEWTHRAKAAAATSTSTSATTAPEP